MSQYKLPESLLNQLEGTETVLFFFLDYNIIPQRSALSI